MADKKKIVKKCAYGTLILGLVVSILQAFGVPVAQNLVDKVSQVCQAVIEIEDAAESTATDAQP